MSDDPYVYPGSSTLKNRFDILDSADLARIEKRITRAAMRSPISPTPPLNADGYRQIHKHIFQEVYPWAGEIRTCELGKPVWFVEARNIKPLMEERFSILKNQNYLKNLGKSEFASRAAEHLCELNDIHAFREGNGRTNRVFAKQLASQAGYDLQINKIDRKAWMDASILGFNRSDFSLMKDVLEKAIQPMKGRSTTHSKTLDETLQRAKLVQQLNRSLDGQSREPDKNPTKGRGR